MQLDFVLIYQHLYIYWTTEQILLAIFSATLQFFRVRGSWKHLQYREPTHVSSEKIKIIVVLGQVSNKTKRPELSRKQAVTILFDGSIKPHGQTSVNSISTTLHTNLRFSKKIATKAILCGATPPEYSSSQWIPEIRWENGLQTSIEQWKTLIDRYLHLHEVP